MKTEKWNKIWIVLNRLSLLLTALWACTMNFIMESCSRHSVFAAWEYMTGSPRVFFYNAFMIFITFSVVYLIRRRVFARIVLSALWLMLGVVNGVMLAKRVTPFNAQDLKTFTEGLSLFTNYFSKIELVLMAVGVGMLLLILAVIWKKGAVYHGKVSRLFGIALVVICVLSYTAITGYVIDKRIVSTYFGNIAFAYQDYGLPYCFAASVFNTGIDQPHDYDEKSMKAIDKNECLNEISFDGDKKPNVLFVQLESFFDTREYEALETSKDPLPNLRKLFKNYSSGYFKVPSVGAGTANTEFEVLMGMNLRYFGPGEYPYKTVLKHQVAESAATAFGALGYGTHALHNNGGNFYSRAKVFHNVGFDSYTSKEFMNILQLTENGWAKDEILVPYIKDAMDSTEQQDFVFAISVQGHGSYPEEKLIADPEITVTGMDSEAKNNKWEYYVNQVYEMDQFVAELIHMLEERGEPTVCVFYGDHLPTMGLEASDMKSRYLYNTNYAIWDNIGLEKEDRNIPAYQIMAEVMQRIGVHSGTFFNYHQQRRESKNYLLDLELLQYDILYGKQYVYKGHVPITEGHMQMGIRDVTVDTLKRNFKGGYSLYGNNLTKWSRLYINGEKQSSTFLNDKRLEFGDLKLEEGDIITVSQVGSSNTIFRTSREYVWFKNMLMEYTDKVKGQMEAAKAKAEAEALAQEMDQAGETDAEPSEKTE